MNPTKFRTIAAFDSKGVVHARVTIFPGAGQVPSAMYWPTDPEIDAHQKQIQFVSWEFAEEWIRGFAKKCDLALTEEAS